MYGVVIPIGSEPQVYPALIARIGEDRRLTYGEFRRLVIRIRREVCPISPADSRRHRQDLRTVLAALGLI